MATKEEKNNFSEIILTRMHEYNIDCLDAIISYCEEKELEMEVAATLVNDVLKSHLETQFADLHFIERTEKLPL